MMDSLLVKLDYIQTQCQDPKKKKEKEEEMKTWDDFTKLRKKLASDVRNIRQQINERNELLGNAMGNTTTVKMSQDIRNGLKALATQADELDTLQRREAEKMEKKKVKGKPVAPEEQEEVEERAQIVILCRQHIEECRKLEKSVRGTKNTFSDENNTSAMVTELPDIDGEKGQLLKENDRMIDQELTKVGEGVQRLKQKATAMGQEIEMQGRMIDEIDTKVVKVNEKLVNLNKRMKKTLEGVRKADRFCIDVILIIIILAIAGYLYNMFRK
eukprot:TRINITY_DN989_c0_g1_i1.p1 TRINITY_DN989_c0_g1~~TRINITY_DN989_c0_g1_i1.p1  ORF type:complete len:271 (-),score=106.47 TRINITY_DN989_c0_g1_i1:58-870(-)